MPTTPLRVLLVDDHEVVRSGIRHMLSAESDIAVVGEAGSAREAISEAERVVPDVVVMDVRLGDGNGVEATREIRARRPATQVLMLTAHDDDEALFSSIMAGAAGYVLKNVRGSDLIDAIRRVAAGQSLLDPAVTARVLERIRGRERPPELRRLSSRERDILGLIAEGCTNREIATRLGLTEPTVKTYVSRLFTKLDIQRRAQAAVLATKLLRKQ
jgi:two-component system response regulator DevR